MFMTIALEGIDGSGKSTQALLLKKYLLNTGVKNVTLTGPLLTEYGIHVRDLYLKNIEMSPLTQVYLLASVVNQLVTEHLEKKEASGMVILDRYIYSTYAYHGIGLDLGIDTVKSIFRYADKDIFPDVIFLLDLPVEIAQSRLSNKRDRIESFSLSFHRKVRNAYLNIASTANNFVILDGTLGIEDLHSIIIDFINNQ